MRVTSRTLIVPLALATLALATGCVEEPAPRFEPRPDPLVGRWVWHGDDGAAVSVIEVDGQLAAEQISALAPPNAPPSHYALTLDAGALWLDGWFSGEKPCDPTRRVCDAQGRERLLYAMTHHLDGDTWLPFAMQRAEAPPDGSPAHLGTWQAELLTLAPLPGESPDATPTLLAHEIWSLELGPDGQFVARHTRSDFVELDDAGTPQMLEPPRETVLERSLGRYSLQTSGRLVLIHAPDAEHPEGRLAEHRLDTDAGVLSLESLVFEREAP